VTIITGWCAQAPRYTSNALPQTADSLLGAVSLRRSTELTIHKLFVADGQAAVVGGRNLMDAYFGLGGLPPAG